jgi:general secretion pathway protein G
MKRNARKGFTLIEVLLVVMILAMLAAFAVPRIMDAGDRAKVNAARAAVGPTGPIGTALNMFKLEVGRFPTTEEGLGALVVKPSTLEGAEGDNWHKYMDQAQMLNDPWNTPYGYKFPGDVNTDGYDLWSNGPDRQQGTADDITNWVRTGN